VPQLDQVWSGKLWPSSPQAWSPAVLDTRRCRAWRRTSRRERRSRRFSALRPLRPGQLAGRRRERPLPRRCGRRLRRAGRPHALATGPGQRRARARRRAMPARPRPTAGPQLRRSRFSRPHLLLRSRPQRWPTLPGRCWVRFRSQECRRSPSRLRRFRWSCRPFRCRRYCPRPRRFPHCRLRRCLGSASNLPP
jgi:hypothetical protein